jgi:hypothetical protein
MFRFNERTNILIYDLYNGNNNPFMEMVIKHRFFLKGYFRYSSNINLLSSDFRWINGDEENMKNQLTTYTNDINLLIIRDFIYSSTILGHGLLDKLCGDAFNAFGFIKIWFKTLNENQYLSGDLNRIMDKEFVFTTNPLKVGNDILDVEREISENTLIKFYLR